MLSAHAGLITTINANGRNILLMAAILSVPDVISWFSAQLQIPSTKLQTSTKSQATNSIKAAN